MNPNCSRLCSRHMTLGKFLLLGVLTFSTEWALMSFLVQRRNRSQGTQRGTRSKEALFLPGTQFSYQGPTVCTYIKMPTFQCNISKLIVD